MRASKPPAKFSLATLDVEGVPTAAMHTRNRYWLLERNVTLKTAGSGTAGNLVEIMRDWNSNFPRLCALAESLASGTTEIAGIPVANATILTPLRYPGKVLCTGANYSDHLEEMNVSYARSTNDQVFFFLKPPTTSLVGPGKTVRMQLDTRMLDWEIEVAAIIGLKARHVRVEDALKHIAGYSIAVDMSARDLLVQPESIFKFNFLCGKGQDTGCPLGPEVVPAAFIDDPQDLEMELRVNNVIMQRGRTSQMIFSIAEQIASASRYTTLEPGDIILTGTCAGVGFPRRKFLSIGDTVTATVSGLGTLEFIIQPSDEP